MKEFNRVYFLHCLNHVVLESRLPSKENDPATSESNVNCDPSMVKTFLRYSKPSELQVVPQAYEHFKREIGDVRQVT